MALDIASWVHPGRYPPSRTTCRTYQHDRRYRSCYGYICLILTEYSNIGLNLYSKAGWPHGLRVPDGQMASWPQGARWPYGPRYSHLEAIWPRYSHLEAIWAILEPPGGHLGHLRASRRPYGPRYSL